MAESAALSEAIRERIVVLDGATATMLQSTFDPSAPVDRLCLIQPERIAQLHRAYLEVGAEIISTNSFMAAGLPDGEEIGRAAASIARAEADHAIGRRWVAGVLGPTTKSAEGYQAAARGLIAGGADLLLIETVVDVEAATAAIQGVRALSERVPLLISASVKETSDVDAFWTAVAPAKPLAVGLNCAYGAEPLRAHLRHLSGLAAGVPILVYPNAGVPEAVGPESMAASLQGFAEEGLVNIVGGCCGTSPAYVAAIKSSISGREPRRLRGRPGD